MTADERLMILQMVADKKLTAEEAVELLKAIDGVREGESTSPRTGQTEFDSTGPSAQSDSPRVKGTGGGFGSFIEEMVDRVTTVLSEAVEPRYSFPTELSGEFTGDEISLRIHTGNGRVTVQSWDQPGYRATVLVKARGSNEAEAIQRAKEAFTVKADESGFELEARRFEGWDLAIHVTLMVPRSKRYRLESRTGNGQILLEDVQLMESNVTTGNGKIICTGGEFDRLALKSGNGSIDVEGRIIDLSAESGNGSVAIRPTATWSQALRLSTGNGTVRVHTDRLGPAAAYRVMAHTGIGSVNVGLPGLVFERELRSMAHKQVLASSPNFDTSESQVSIVARTGMGSITID